MFFFLNSKYIYRMKKNFLKDKNNRKIIIFTSTIIFLWIIILVYIYYFIIKKYIQNKYRKKVIKSLLKSRNDILENVTNDSDLLKNCAVLAPLSSKKYKLYKKLNCENKNIVKKKCKKIMKKIFEELNTDLNEIITYYNNNSGSYGPNLNKYNNIRNFISTFYATSLIEHSDAINAYDSFITNFGNLNLFNLNLMTGGAGDALTDTDLEKKLDNFNETLFGGKTQFPKTSEMLRKLLIDVKNLQDNSITRDQLNKYIQKFNQIYNRSKTIYEQELNKNYQEKEKCQKELEEIKEKIKLYDVQYNDNIDEKQKLQKIIDELNEKITDAENKINNLNEKIRNAENKINKLSLENSDLQKKIEENNVIIQQLNYDIDHDDDGSVGPGYIKSIELLKQEISDLKLQNKNSNDNNLELEKQIKSLKEKIDNANDIIKNLNLQNSGLQKKIEENNQQIQNLNYDINHDGDNFDGKGYIQRIELLKQQISDLKLQNKNSNDNNLELEKQIESLKEEIDNANDTIKNLNLQNSDLQKQIIENNVIIQNLNNNIELQKEEILDLKSKNKTSNDNNLELEKQILQNKENIKILENDVKQKYIDNKNLNEKLRQNQTEIENLKKNIDQKNIENLELKKQISLQEKNILSSKEKINELNILIKNLNFRISKYALLNFLHRSNFLFDMDIDEFKRFYHFYKHKNNVNNVNKDSLREYNDTEIENEILSLKNKEKDEQIYENNKNVQDNVDPKYNKFIRNNIFNKLEKKLRSLKEIDSKTLHLFFNKLEILFDDGKNHMVSFIFEYEKNTNTLNPENFIKLESIISKLITSTQNIFIGEKNLVLKIEYDEPTNNFNDLVKQKIEERNNYIMNYMGEFIQNNPQYVFNWDASYQIRQLNLPLNNENDLIEKLKKLWEQYFLKDEVYPIKENYF